MHKEQKIVIGVLAGGESRRTGEKNKLFFDTDDGPFIYRIVKNCLMVTDVCISVAGEESQRKIKDALAERLCETDLERISFSTDKNKSFGPLEGIRSLLQNTNGDAVMVIAGDMPFVSSGVIRDFIEGYKDEDARILKTGEKIHPTFGIYSKRLLSRIESFIEEGEHKPVKLLERVNTIYVPSSSFPVSEEAFSNINTIEEYEYFFAKDKK